MLGLLLRYLSNLSFHFYSIFFSWISFLFYYFSLFFLLIVSDIIYHFHIYPFIYDFSFFQPRQKIWTYVPFLLQRCCFQRYNGRWWERYLRNFVPSNAQIQTLNYPNRHLLQNQKLNSSLNQNQNQSQSQSHGLFISSSPPTILSKPTLELQTISLAGNLHFQLNCSLIVILSNGCWILFYYFPFDVLHRISVMRRIVLFVSVCLCFFPIKISQWSD